MKMTMTNERNYATTKKFKSDSNVTAIDKLCSLTATTGLPPNRTSTYKTNEWTEATNNTAQYAQSANHVIFGMSVGNKKKGFPLLEIPMQIHVVPLLTSSYRSQSELGSILECIPSCSPKLSIRQLSDLYLSGHLDPIAHGDIFSVPSI